jgi:hypothetical protein
MCCGNALGDVEDMVRRFADDSHLRAGVLPIQRQAGPDDVLR